MELKKLEQLWNSFPEMSLEERPVLSSDLENMVVKNPLSDAFYLRRRLLIRIGLLSILWLLDVWQLRVQWKSEGTDVYQIIAFLALLSYTIFFHVRLLLFADYPTLLAQPLIAFLSKLEVILDKYMFSFKFLSWVIGFCLLALFENGLSRINTAAYVNFSHNDWYKWLVLIFLSVSVDILLLHIFIPRYKKLTSSIRKYKEGIQAKAQNK
jgi:hypothetical protein